MCIVHKRRVSKTTVLGYGTLERPIPKFEGAIFSGVVDYILVEVFSEEKQRIVRKRRISKTTVLGYGTVERSIQKFEGAIVSAVVDLVCFDVFSEKIPRLEQK